MRKRDLHEAAFFMPGVNPDIRQPSCRLFSQSIRCFSWASGFRIVIHQREQTMTISPPLRLTSSVAAFCFIAAPLPALAQISPTNQIIGCQSIDNDVERLKCFDQVAGRLNTVNKKPVSRSLTPVMPKPAPMVPNVPTPSPPTSAAETIVYPTNTTVTPSVEKGASIEDFGKDPNAALKPQEATLQTPKGKAVFTVKHVQIFGFIKKRLYMTNGQVWEQTTGSNLSIDEGKPPQGTTVIISKTAFGGYMMKLSDKKSRVKVKRVR